MTLKEQVKELKIKEPMECKDLLIKNIEEQMDIGKNAYDFENQRIRNFNDWCKRGGKNHFHWKTGKSV